ncbi:MAG TPA: class I SAM-dependent methyltransferase [Albitalea sp.]|nr:class I SAM-dependent methyltransferase [Albitalea sp.]
MSMNKAELTQRETYVQQRYLRWRTMVVPFAYKGKKGERIAEIIRTTGGMPSLVVEIGVGPGGVARSVSQSGARVVGMDLSAEALGRAREHCRDADVRLLRGSGFALPFADRSVPVVYASQVLHLFDAQGRLALMREVRRVLQPGGRFIFDMKNVATHAWRFASSPAEKKARNFPGDREIRRLLEEVGFGSTMVRAGLFPVFGMSLGTDAGALCALAHTRFYVARS